MPMWKNGIGPTYFAYAKLLVLGVYGLGKGDKYPSKCIDFHIFSRRPLNSAYSKNYISEMVLIKNKG